MSIRILPDNEIQHAASQFQVPTLLYANPKSLYERRAKRLRQLAENHPLADYLHFVADIVTAQSTLFTTQPIADHREQLAQILQNDQGIMPLASVHFPLPRAWRGVLLQLVDEIRARTQENETVIAVLDWLEKASENELDTLADHLRNGDFHKVDADKSIFIWAALSLYWVQLTQQLPKNVQAQVGTRCHCPVCGAMPVAGMVHFGEAQGLRYLHCALCETQWNVVRAKCSNCEQSGRLEYWSEDTPNTAIKAECCEDCGSYVKMVYQEKDPYVEVIADDLASILLDADMAEKGFARSSMNPFLFPSE